MGLSGYALVVPVKVEPTPMLMSRCPEGQGPPETTPQVQAPCPHGLAITEPPPPASCQPTTRHHPTDWLGSGQTHHSGTDVAPFLHDDDLPALGEEVVLSPAGYNSDRHRRLRHRPKKSAGEETPEKGRSSNTTTVEGSAAKKLDTSLLDIALQGKIIRVTETVTKTYDLL